MPSRWSERSSWPANLTSIARCSPKFSAPSPLSPPPATSWVVSSSPTACCACSRPVGQESNNRRAHRTYHQRRVQQRRNAADHFKSDKRGQHENVEAGQQVQLHDFATSLDAAGKAGSEKNSRTRALKTSPSWVSSVSRTISSSRFSCSLPSLTRCSRNALRFRAYIWLAW